MSDERFAEFTAALGESHDLEVTEDASGASDKGIYRVALDKDDRNQLDFIRGNDFWHMDGTVYDAPGKATLLNCEVPPREGGDIPGMGEAEGRALLESLVEWATGPRFTYRHKWQKGDLVIFNNPGLLHRSYPNGEAAGRVMHRTTLKGTEAIA